MKRILINLIVWGLCAAAAIIASLWQLVASITDSKRCWTIARGFDQTLNAAFGGHEDEMISTKIFRKAREGKTWAIWAEKILNWLDKNHTEDSYKADNP